MINRPYRIMLIAILALSPAQYALGQAGWRQSLPALQDSDIERIKNTARKEMTGKPVGTELDWSNADTGNHGTVRLADRFQRNERECRTLEHVVNIQSQGRWRNAVTICRAPNGLDWEWAHPRGR